jgi:MFS family permease
LIHQCQHCLFRFGSRTTCIVGSIISSAAIFASSYSTSLIHLLITYGVLAGFGLGFVYIPAVVAVGEYFREKLSLATGYFLRNEGFYPLNWCLGICVCGSGAGTFLVAPLTSLLLRQFGWRGCNRVMSLLCLACSLFGLVMVPNKKKVPKNISDNSEIQNPGRKDNSGRSLLCNIPFLLMTVGNIPFAMAIYISYTYLPSVSHI